MNRIRAFALRNWKETLRDPLSYIFCLGFPLVMLGIMTVVNQSIPANAGLTIFRIDRLSAGVAVFGHSFIMLFAALSVANDRAGAFLVRMYTTPMKPSEFICGYILPLWLMAMAQAAPIWAASLAIGAATGVSLPIGGLLLAWATLIPSALLFIGIGVLFGTLFSEKAAPGMCSILISLGSFLGAIWFDAESTGGVLLTVSKALPFFHCTKSARSAVALALSFEDYGRPLLMVIGWMALILALAVLAFRRRMRADLA